MTLQEAALAVGATQLGEKPHFIFDLEKLAAFLALVAKPAPPPLPYSLP